jgi:rhodanese-related sulfurtransferase
LNILLCCDVILIKRKIVNILEMFFNSTESFAHVDSKRFAEIINETPNSIILDVRTREEHQTFRIPNSILIDFNSTKFTEKLETLDTTKTYLVYCASGARSLGACKQMKKMGFEKIFNLKNGILSWRGEMERG